MVRKAAGDPVACRHPNAARSSWVGSRAVRACYNRLRLRGIAQSGRALGWGPSGRRFESVYPDHQFSFPSRPNERRAFAVGLLLLLALTACKETGEESFRRGAYKDSFVAFTLRAENGEADALNYLGVHYYLGLGVERDWIRAADFFDRAAIAGHRGACRNLGILYLRGLGVSQDRVKAYAWFFAAFDAGDALAFKYLEYAADYITPNQSMGARRWVTEYLRDART